MFKLAATREAVLASFDDTLGYIAEEKRRIVRLPLVGLWQSGARFVDDGRLGIGSSSVGFNEEGLSSLCDLLGLPPSIPRRLARLDLASDLLNDLMVSAIDAGGRMRNAEIVVDQEAGTAMGVVSTRYVGYSNDSFVRDIMRALDPANDGALFPDTGDLAFRQAISINGRLFLRLASKSVRGVVSGRGGKGDDISEIGVEASNAMAGGHAVKLSWYVHRLICANGLVAPVAGGQGRIVHAGREDNFRNRLHHAAHDLFHGLGKAKRMIESLGSIPFDPDGLARHADPVMVFGLIPGRDLKGEALARAKAAANASTSIDSAKVRTRDAIAQLPFCLGGSEARAVFSSWLRDGASMYDFVNIFTEHAKSLSMQNRLTSEANAGVLANWIVANRRRFH